MTTVTATLPATAARHGAAARASAALRLAGHPAERAVTAFRSAVDSLGAFGVALLALYPVAIVATIAAAGFMLTGRAAPM